MLTKQYRQMLEAMHRDPALKWGNDGKHHITAVVNLAQRVQAKTLLDFGCGRSTLSKTIKFYGYPLRCTDYDPGRPKKANLPKELFDIVTCTDVLEHVEPEHLDNVLNAIALRTDKAAYFVIDTVEAKTVLPDGRNAHLIVKPAEWWLKKLRTYYPKDFWWERAEYTPKKLTVELVCNG